MVNLKNYTLVKCVYCGKSKIEYETSSRIKNKFTFKESKIKKITKTTYTPKQVYNLSVDEDDSFVINGIVVHNTKPHPFIKETIIQEFAGILAEALKVKDAVEVFEE